MKRLISLIIVIFFPLVSFGQGTLGITFDGPPLQPPGSAVLVQQYFEAGIYFQPLPGSDGFIRGWTNRSNLWPNNGTPYLQAALGNSLMFNFQDNSLFGVVSVDIAGYSTVVPDVTAHFTGYRADGSIVSTNFSSSGINFQTYYFDPQWSSLTRVEVPDFGSLDNLVIQPIPEPSIEALIVLGVAVGWLLRRRRKQL